MDEDVIDVSPDYDAFQFDMDLTDAELDEFLARLKERGYIGIGMISDMDKRTVVVVARKPTKES